MDESQQEVSGHEDIVNDDLGEGPEPSPANPQVSIRRAVSHANAHCTDSH